MAVELKVNVHKRALRAAERVETNGKMQGSLLHTHLPLQLPWRERVRQFAKRTWVRFVVTKNEGRYSISQPLALVVIGGLLSIGGIGWWRSSDKIQEQHDEIIRLQTKLEAEQTKNIDQDSKIDQARNFATIADKNQARLEGKFDQFALIYSIKNADKVKMPID